MITVSPLNIIKSLLLGYLQQTNNVDGYNSMQPDAGKSEWPAQTFHTVQGNFYGQAQRSIPEKPCSRRSLSDSEPIGQQLSPPLASNVEPLIRAAAAAPLKPQALRHEEYDPKTTTKQVLLSNPQLAVVSNKLSNARNSLPILNPVIDSTEELIPPTNNEILEDNPKPSEQMRSTPTSDSLSASSSGDKSADNRREQQVPVSALRIAPSDENDAPLDHHYISEPNELRSQKKRTDNNEFPGFVANFDNTEAQTLAPSLIAKLLNQPEVAAAMTSNKCSHDKEPDSVIGHSRRSMSSYNDENNAKAVLRNDKDYIRNNNNPYLESHIENENAMASVLSAEKSTPMPNNGRSLGILDKTSVHENSVSHEKPATRDARREMIEPTHGAGVMGKSALMMMQSDRICYACSTANNPSCWAPDRKTTVKYCRKGNIACLTKTFGHGSKLFYHLNYILTHLKSLMIPIHNIFITAAFTLIRDCGKSCDDDDTTGLAPKYKSCSMCHSDLCNGAYSINGQSVIFALILISLVKYFN